MFRDEDITARVITRLRDVGTRTARAGIFSAGKEHEAEKLVYQEFGTKHAPQRQTMAPAFDESEDHVVDLVAEGVDATLAGMAPGQHAAELAGQHLENAIKAKIDSNVEPTPLADSTLAARRRRGITGTRTLVAEGDMLKAVEHDVVMGEGSSDG